MLRDVKPSTAYLLGFVGVVVIQVAYFYLHEGFDLLASIAWAVLDWSVWFLMYLAVFYHDEVTGRWLLPKNRLGLMVTIAISFPIVHAAIAYYIYQEYFHIEENYFVQLGALISRRWFHNMLTAVVFAFIFEHVKLSLDHGRTYHDSAPEEGRLVLKDGTRVYQISAEEIQWVSVAKNYVIVQSSAEQLMIRMTLQQMFDKIKGFGFLKISRSVIVKMSLIKMVERQSQYRQSVVMTNGQAFPIGRTYLKTVLEKIGS